ncbi:MAG: rRNA maturation RNase YbeY [Leptospirales bacterium]|nr:rRNA maturation RNase YbeY [Leptospirales bacterium]
MRTAAEQALQELCRIEGMSSAFELSLQILDAPAMSALNKRSRSRDYATDVLSFPMLDFPAGKGPAALPRDGAGQIDLGPVAGTMPAGQALLLGDISICRDVCLQQASEIGHSVGDEFLRLLVHGLLHLFGYDHELGPEEERQMQQREDQLLSCLPGIDAN